MLRLRGTGDPQRYRRPEKVQATRKHALPFQGTIGARRVPNAENLHEVEHVIEKPTPTQAQQTLLVLRLRAGHHLCLIGMHVLTPGVVQLLRSLHAQRPTPIDVLTLPPRSKRYLAPEYSKTRYNVGVKHGLLIPRLANALSGPDRDDILTQLVELLAKKP